MVTPGGRIDKYLLASAEGFTVNRALKCVHPLLSAMVCKSSQYDVLFHLPATQFI